MKKYMMIFMGPSQEALNMTPAEAEENMNQWFAWMAKLEQDGVYKGGEALMPVVRQVSGPDRTVTDRAGSEIKELVGGYCIIEARDMDHMVEIAAGFPDYNNGGTVEIREVMVFN